jgi:hypothetical protein
LHEINLRPNFAAHINEDTIMAGRQLATADALVLSCSSFSLLAGILTKHGTHAVVVAGNATEWKF